MRAVAVAGVALVALVGCSEPDRFSLKVSWSSAPGQACPKLEPTPALCAAVPLACDFRSCAAIPMSCDAWVRLRVIGLTEPPVTYFSECYQLAAGENLCGLGDLKIPAGVDIPNRMVRIQLAVWSADQLSGLELGESNCPQGASFYSSGQPMLTDPIPAIGGEIYFPVGQGEVAELELHCPDQDQLDTEACRNESIVVDADVLDPALLRSVTVPEAEDLKVSFAEPRQFDVDRWRLMDPTTLERAGGSDPRWSATVEGPIRGTERCLRVSEEALEEITVATCQRVTVSDTGGVSLEGVRLEYERAQKVTQLAQRLGAGPNEPVVFGLVVDSNNAAISGVTVTPSGAGSSVVYPNAALDDYALDVTGSAGYFLSIDAQYRSTWDAIGPGLIDDGSAIGGLIENHVTVVIVRMVPS